MPGLHPDRAPTIVAGAVILVESMRAFGLDPMETSEADILHGAALESRLPRGRTQGGDGLDKSFRRIPPRSAIVEFCRVGSAVRPNPPVPL